MKPVIGLIGLGRMGRPMAQNLIKAGYQLVVYDIRKEAMEGLSEVKYEKASSPRDVASRSSVVITMLPASPDVEEVVLGSEGVIEGAESGDIVIDMSSSYPTSTKMISERLAAKSIRMMDAPVSGGTTGADAGTLTIMVGGEKEDFEEFLPLFEALGRKIYYVDGIGAGHTVKALNNLCSACSICITGEALVVATKLGLDPGKVNEIMNNSSGRSYSTDTKFPNFILNGTFKSGFTAGLMNKDVQMANRLARELHFPMLVGSIVEQLYNHAVGQGMADKGSGSVVKLMEDWASVKVRSK